MKNLIQYDKDITSMTTFGIPAKAKYFAEYSSVKELREIIRSDEFQSSEIFHIGGGSNLLFLSDYDGLILHSAIRGITDYRKDDQTVYVIAGAAENWAQFVDWCVDHGYAGLENMAYIPGEVGASAIQNVGAYGVEAKDVIYKVECYDFATNRVVTLENHECRFAYRDSIFKNEARGRYAVLRVCFRLKPATLAEHLDYGPLKALKQDGRDCTISLVRDEITRIRKQKLPEPSERGSAGSFFKNPVVRRKFFESNLLATYGESVPYYDVDDDHVKVPAGWLIEKAGLKGYKLGNAQVYENQALVIVNNGGATGQEIADLCQHIRRTVHDTFNIILHPEVNFIDSRVKVTVLGSGTSKGVPEAACRCKVCQSTDALDRRSRASIMVQTHGVNLLIDASPDFREQALRNEITDIDALLLTHIHFDHIGGIEDLRPYCDGKDMPIYAKGDVADELRQRLDYCFREKLYPGVPTYKLHIINPDYDLKINGVKITPIVVNHGRLPILGYRIGNFAYITDAKSIDDEELLKLKGVDTLIINALRYEDHFAHFTVDEALDIIDRVKPRQTYLTHINHDMGFHQEVVSQLPDGVTLAHDSLVFSV